ncbi:PARG1-like protein [Mya arenaria]|uniref:PARG1-like protein n=1 Tax=Mya arenaria TaxID=6604 RepID=A0ABY7FZ60_MYAAR|nr:PARG1-like protein [Mya arenaria]
MQMIAVRHQTIVDINMGFPYQQPTSWENCIFSGLCKFFRKPDHVGELPKFISHTLPAIIDLAFDVEHILPPEGDQREIPRLLCWSIVACGFLCLFPNEERGFGTRLNTINFNRFFAHLPLWSQNAKLQCILHFFDRVHAEKTNASGNIIFTRQEEVRFTVCPELVAAMLFMESMEENEAIVISGFQQYSMMCGYAAGLEFVGDNEDKAEVDERGNLKTTLCAIDASRDDHSRGTKRSATVKHHKQYDDRVLLRDINKAFVEQVPNLALIDEFVENLLSSAMILALPLASRALQAEESGASTFPVNRESSSTNSDTDVVSAISLVDSIQQRQSSMDHLDVNFREWYNNYRRRSSNLSDLSSRRSSYDCASRRSSNCSARGGYSSEFSSEFEEYYDNFQQQERYKYHTITEEVGSAAVMEFASTLAASLLQAGTQEAAHGYINDEDNQENNISEDNLVDNTDVEHDISEDDVNKNDSKSNTNFSESSQSDHSIDAKDQSDSSFQESSSYSQTNQANHGKIDPAVQVAEKMVSVGRDSNKGLVDSVASPSKCQQSCDSTVKVVIDSVPIKHSTTTSDNLSHNEREMYSRIADKILLQGLSPGYDTELARSIKMDELASGNDSLTDKRKLFCEPTVPSFGRSSSQSESNSQESDSSCVPNSSVSSGLSSCAKLSSLDKSKLKTSVKNEREFKHTVPVEISQDLQSANIDYDMLGARPKVKESVVPKPKAGKSTSENKQSEVRISNRSFSNSDSNESCGSSFRIPSTSPDTSSSDNSAHHGAIGAKSHMTSHVITAVIPASPGESNPKSHSKLKSKPCFPFMTGNKKNYDQFANSLSRDLLTNAFLQVQEHRECVSYPRRSSEPMQISNDAALQRLENSINHRNGRRTGKSKTDEDISLMDWEWSQQITTKTSSGFRDPLLSRFAEELMKANVSIPPLQLLGADQVSISSSSQSVCSTMSSFRDPLLASFEEELINNSLKITTSAKTVTSWSKMKGSMCSSRHVGINNSANQGGSLKSQNNLNNNKVGKRNSQSGKFGQSEERRQITINVSQDSDNRAISWKSVRSSSLYHVPDVTDYADSLSRTIICEALTAVYALSSCKSDTMSDRQMYAVDLYSDLLAKSILASAMVTVEMVNTDWSEQNRVVTWSDKTECVQYSEANLEDDVTEKRDMESCVDPARCSSEYEDALDIPYQYLEQFADVLASKVLINSVAISRREHLSSLRQQYGRPIATGNWGCGAFGGDPHLKSLLQWMAASYAGCPCLLYYTFQNANMEKEVVDLILERGWDVSRLMQVVRRYCITTCEEIEASGAPTRQLFDVILQGEIFPAGFFN